MPSQNTTARTQGKRETLLKDAIVCMVRRTFESDGLEAARQGFERAKALFSYVYDWPDIEEEVHGFFVERRREALQAEHERQQQLDNAMITGLVKGIDINQANLLTGAYSQAPYHQAASIIGGHKQ